MVTDSRSEGSSMIGAEWYATVNRRNTVMVNRRKYIQNHSDARAHVRASGLIFDVLKHKAIIIQMQYV